MIEGRLDYSIFKPWAWFPPHTVVSASLSKSPLSID
jgi:hypothetical protein